MTEQQIIRKALNILESRLQKPEHHFTKPDDTASYLKLNLGELEHESFNVMFLNNQHGLISLTEMFRGTIDGAAVYPREIVKAALKFNAAAVILAHNHPSGMCTPSMADRHLTQQIRDALNLVEVRVLDHIVVGGTNSYSFAEHGLM